MALPLAFGSYVWSQYGGERGVEYYTGYLVLLAGQGRHPQWVSRTTPLEFTNQPR